MDLKNIKGKLVVVTGGSSGIGYSIAERMAGLGARLLLVARNEAKLNTAATQLRKQGAEEVLTLSVDVANADDLSKLRDKVAEMGAAADVVINSAGIVSAGLLHEMPISEWDRLHGVNVRGLVLVLQTLIPEMIAENAKDGQARHIVNIASAAGYSGVPGMSAYGATKAAVTALSESLRAELGAHQIGVTAVCPGFVKTPIAETVQLFGRMNTPKTQKNIEKMFAYGNLSPETVAEQTLKAIGKNKGFVTIGRDAVGGHLLKRFAPGMFSAVVAKTARVK